MHAGWGQRGGDRCTKMAHLPDDMLPSEFDVVVEGTGELMDATMLSVFEIKLLVHVAILIFVS